MRNVAKLWQLDSFPHRNEKEVTRSKLDQYALHLLDSLTERVNIDRQMRYATPLLRHPNFPSSYANKSSALPLLLCTKRRLKRDPLLAQVHSEEVCKLVDAGYVTQLEPGSDHTVESWFLPHHVVRQHRGKHRLVFNCSYQHQGQSLNNNLLPGPILGPSLVGVLLRFWQSQSPVTSKPCSIKCAYFLKTSPSFVSSGDFTNRKNLISMNGKFYLLVQHVALAVPFMPYNAMMI